AATVAGAWWPARTARALPPAATLKGLGAVGQAPARAWTGMVLIAASALLASVPPVFGIPLAAYVAVGLMLLGGMAMLPWLLERVLGGLQRLWPAALRQPLSMLALERARRMRASASVAVGGVVASLSLAVALTVMVTSFRGSMLDWLDAVLPSPLYLRAAGGSSKSDAALLPPALLQAVRDMPGVERAQPLRATSLWLDAQRPAITLLLRPLHGPQAQQLPWVGAAPSHAVPAGMVAVYVSEAVATLYGVQVGQPWPLLDRAFASGTSESNPASTQAASAQAAHFFIAGIWRDYIRQFGAVAMDWGDYQRLTGDARMSELSLWPSPGDSQSTLQPRIESALAQLSGGQAAPLEFTSSAALRQRSLDIFDRSFAVTYWLQAVAIGIGLFGIAASFSAQVLARRKEFGLLTHLGLTRRQILTVVAGEGAAWTAMGALAGTLLGLGVAAILVHVVNPQSFHWTMELRLPAARLLALACAVVLAGTLTAWWAGRQATGEDAVLAVKEDW
ncbi:MAG: FtsX-like permease family protein, partial [Comamonas sp.]